MTDSIAEPWSMDHRLHVLNQIESRLGPADTEGVRWMERRLTGKVIAVCSCGLNTGLVDRGQMRPAEELAAEHSPSL
ncbi:hypothetical protein AB0D57_14930 [Streptomyces sp. NPDC048275]|uniref:hypothetical protein n=1 Tax=Streptomyces sp. NPDC048275 TaxID=3155629 RepID=UPI0033DAB9AF